MIAQRLENIHFLVILSTNSFRSLSLKWIIREEMGKKGRGGQIFRPVGQSYFGQKIQPSSKVELNEINRLPKYSAQTFPNNRIRFGLGTSLLSSPSH
jgi:hypothetical protein